VWLTFILLISDFCHVYYFGFFVGAQLSASFFLPAQFLAVEEKLAFIPAQFLAEG
jgi:hypothetical protein